MRSFNQHIDIKLVSFDWWLTIGTYSDTQFRDKRNDMLRLAIAPELTKVDFTALQTVQDDISDAIAETAAHDELFSDRVQRLATAAGRPPLSDVAIKDLYNAQSRILSMHSPVLTHPDTTPGVLKALASHKQIALISNTGFIHGDQLRKVIVKLGIERYFDYLIFSNEIGKAKPNPLIFQTLIERSGLRPDQIVHIGDNYAADYEGARRVGMYAMHIEKGAELGPAVEQALKGGN